MDDETEASKISIHALREEGDRRSMTSPGIPLNFYPRPPRGGRPHRRLPVWLVLCHFYPRPPRGGRHLAPFLPGVQMLISIHALREEGDPPTPRRQRTKSRFLSTPSARRATNKAAETLDFCMISIHALREEGDPSCSIWSRLRPIFLSTPSARRATWARYHHRPPAPYFYPRPPRGGRHLAVRVMEIVEDFYPRPPRGGRRKSQAVTETKLEISIHALREEGDLTKYFELK